MAERDEKIEALKRLAWNLERVSGFAKAEIVKLIDGEEIREDVVGELRAREKELKKSWPNELSEFVFDKIGRI